MEANTRLYHSSEPSRSTFVHGSESVKRTFFMQNEHFLICEKSIFVKTEHIIMHTLLIS